MWETVGDWWSLHLRLLRTKLNLYELKICWKFAHISYHLKLLLNLSIKLSVTRSSAFTSITIDRSLKFSRSAQALLLTFVWIQIFHISGWRRMKIENIKTTHISFVKFENKSIEWVSRLRQFSDQKETSEWAARWSSQTFCRFCNEFFCFVFNLFGMEFEIVEIAFSLAFSWTNMDDEWIFMIKFHHTWSSSSSTLLLRRLCKRATNFNSNGIILIPQTNLFYIEKKSEISFSSRFLCLIVWTIN